mgnify:CR=1 FL=1
MHLDWSGLLLLHSQKCWRQKAHCRFLRILLFLPGLLQQTLQQTPAFLPALQRRPYTQTQGFLRPEFQPGQVPGSAFSCLFFIFLSLYRTDSKNGGCCQPVPPQHPPLSTCPCHMFPYRISLISLVHLCVRLPESRCWKDRWSWWFRSCWNLDQMSWNCQKFLIRRGRRFHRLRRLRKTGFLQPASVQIRRLHSGIRRMRQNCRRYR